MARLSDLVKKQAIQKKVITIQGIDIPATFTMESLEYIQEGYGASYAQFEKDMNEMLSKEKVRMGKKELKLVRSLIYAMINSAGVECTMEELTERIPFQEIPDVYKQALDIFLEENFQESDAKKIKKQKK